MAILGRAQAYRPHLSGLLTFGSPPAIKIVASRRSTGGRRELVKPHLSGQLTLGQPPATRIIFSKRITGGRREAIKPHVTRVQSYGAAPNPKIFLSRRLFSGFTPPARSLVSGLILYSPLSPAPIAGTIYLVKRVNRSRRSQNRPHLPGFLTPPISGGIVYPIFGSAIFESPLFVTKIL